MIPAASPSSPPDGTGRKRGRLRIESSDEGLTTSWGQQLKFDQITALDKKLWRNKGIAKIQYTDADRRRRLALDDCKYDRDATEDLLRLVESKLDPDQIVGGAMETSPDAGDPDADQSDADQNDAAADESS